MPFKVFEVPLYCMYMYIYRPCHSSHVHICGIILSYVQTSQYSMSLLMHIDVSVSVELYNNSSFIM